MHCPLQAIKEQESITESEKKKESLGEDIMVMKHLELRERELSERCLWLPSNN